MINKVVLLGRIGSIGEVTNPAAPVRFSVATYESFKKRGSDEWETVTEWHNIISWGDESYKANLITRLVENKGRMVYVEGKIETEEFNKEGVTVKIQKIKASLVRILPREKTDEERKRSSDERGLSAPAAKKAPARTSRAAKPEASDEDDDLPFK